MGGRQPRVETGDRLSRSGRGKAHALIGGELVRSCVIVSRGANGQLQKQGQARTAQRDRKHIGSQRSARESERRKEGKRVNFTEEESEEESDEDRAGVREIVKRSKMG